MSNAHGAMLTVCLRSERSEQRLTSHAEDAIKRREPGITRLAKDYNDACAQMQQLIQRHNAPRGAVAPCPIDRTKLFTLDVDDNIWQDAGLIDDENDNDESTDSTESVIPRWLADENVRSGINAMLKHDRCEEEERRLTRELNTLWEWGRAEWTAIAVAKAWAGGQAPLRFLYHSDMLSRR